ncbi:hypothetical protein NPX13_g2250 [Xylaria arbuscula]|uniref:Uncharacterized protein n=1 Tax=Xylaria arbuscula TaxID=114810 RepID=A0A9W8NKV8_9PEZI|nr:hypothetical protein NPX13_g2250 [Xylaria arbuscula]
MSNQLPGMVMQTMQPGPLVPLVAVLGDSGVGKTALTIQWCHGQFVETYDPTIEDSYRTQAMVNGQMYPLEVLDTAGQTLDVLNPVGEPNDWDPYTKWITQADGIVLVYSITKPNTFKTIRHLLEQVLSVKKWHTKNKDPDTFRPKRLPIIIVGNQCDKPSNYLNDNLTDRPSERQVSTIEGHRLAQKYGCMFIETSAKEKINVDKAFSDVVKTLPKPLYREVYDDAMSSEGASSQSSIWTAWWTTLLESGRCIFIMVSTSWNARPAGSDHLEPPSQPTFSIPYVDNYNRYDCGPPSMIPTGFQQPALHLSEPEGPPHPLSNAPPTEGHHRIYTSQLFDPRTIIHNDPSYYASDACRTVGMPHPPQAPGTTGQQAGMLDQKGTNTSAGHGTEYTSVVNPCLSTVSAQQAKDVSHERPWSQGAFSVNA